MQDDVTLSERLTPGRKRLPRRIDEIITETIERIESTSRGRRFKARLKPEYRLALQSELRP